MGFNINNPQGAQAYAKTTSYTLNEGDFGNIIVFNALADITVTLPKGLRVGFNCTIVQSGTGKIKFAAPAADAFVNGGDETTKTKGSWAWAKVLCVDANNYTVEFGSSADGGGGGVLPPVTNNGTRLVSGSASWAGTGFIFNVTNCEYYISNVFFNSLATQLTLAAANATYSRIDVIYVDNTNTVRVLTGVPAASPVKPQINPATSVEVTFILIAANATSPANIVNEIIYDENIEWSHNNASNINFDSLINPQKGVKCIRGTNINGTQYINFFKGSNLTASNYNFLRFYIKRPFQTAPTSTNDVPSLKIYFTNNNNTVSADYEVTPAEGFNSQIFDIWQLVTIPLAQIVFSSQNFNSIAFKIATYNNDIIDLDNIVLQGTGPQIILTSQLGNKFLLGVFEDGDGSGILTTTKI